MKVKILFFVLILFTVIPAASAVTCEVNPATTTIDLGLSKKVTITCSDWDVNSVVVDATQYNGACLSLDKTSDTLTSGSNTKDFTVTATSMACQENINDRTIIWKFTPSSGTVPSKSTITTIQSGLTITATFKSEEYTAEEGKDITIVLEVSTTSTEDITGITINTSGSSSELISAGFTTKTISKIAASEGEKTQMVSWTIAAPAEGTYNLRASVTSTNADSDTATTNLTVTESSGEPTPTPTPTPTSTSSGGGGGGGGGGFLPPSIPFEAPSESYRSITTSFKANENNLITVPASMQEVTGVMEIEAVLDQSMDVVATVSKVSALPEAISEAPGEIYTYFEVVFTKQGTSTTLEPAGSIKVRVEKEWINRIGATSSDIKFVKYKYDTWIDVSSEVIDSDDQYYYFKLNLDSFSLFAVIKKSSVSLPSMSFPMSTPTPTATPTPAEDTSDSVTEPETTSTPSSTEGVVSTTYYVIGGVMITLLAIVVVYFVKFKK